VTSCIVDSAAIYIMVVKFRNTTCPPQPQLSLHSRAALASYSNGTRSYIAGRTQSAVYIVRCLWHVLVWAVILYNSFGLKPAYTVDPNFSLFGYRQNFRIRFRNTKTLAHQNVRENVCGFLRVTFLRRKGKLPLTFGIVYLWKSHFINQKVHLCQRHRVVVTGQPLGEDS
jgi:hypothetical protein